MNWFPREYLPLLGAAMWVIMIGAIALVPDWLYNRERRRAPTAAPESHPKSAE